MKFCPVVPEICHGQVHGPRKERKKEEEEEEEEKNKNKNNNNNKKRSKNNNSFTLVNLQIFVVVFFHVDQLHP